MATFFTDFSEYPLGQQPSDWTAHGQSADWIVREAADGSHYLEHSGATNGHHALTWDQIPADTGDVEIAMLVRSVDGHPEPNQPTARYGNSSNDYAATGRHDRLRLVTRVSGSQTNAAEISRDFPEGEPFWVRFRVSSSTLSASSWLRGEAEPAFPETTHDNSSLASGRVGIRYFHATRMEILAFGVGTDGASAPTEAEAPEPLRKAAEFQEDFESPADPEIWEDTSATSNGTIEQTGDGLLRFVFVPGVSSRVSLFYRTVESFDLTDSAIFAEIVLPMAPSNTNWGLQFRKTTDPGGTVALWQCINGGVRAGAVVDGSTVGLTDLEPYDHAAGRFLRFRYAAGELHFDFSADGVIWSTRLSVAVDASAFADAYLEIYAISGQDNLDPGELHVAGVNVVEAPEPVILTPGSTGLTVLAATPTLRTGRLALTPAPLPVALAAPSPNVRTATEATPDALTGSLLAPAPTITAGGLRILPGSLAFALSLPAPSVLAGGLGLHPATRTLQLATPAPVVEAGALRLTPPPLTASLVQPAPGVRTGTARLAPDVLAATLALPQPSVRTGEEPVRPSALPLALATSTPALFAGRITAQPAAAPTSLSAPVPTLRTGGLSIQPAAVAFQATAPGATVRSGPLSIRPAALPLTLELPAPVVRTAEDPLRPQSRRLDLAVPAPVLRTGTTRIRPEALPAALVSRPPVLRSDERETVTPAPLAASLAAPAPGVRAATVLTPRRRVLTLALPAPALGGRATLRPASLSLAAGTPGRLYPHSVPERACSRARRRSPSPLPRPRCARGRRRCGPARPRSPRRYRPPWCASGRTTTRPARCDRWAASRRDRRVRSPTSRRAPVLSAPRSRAVANRGPRQASRLRRWSPDWSSATSSTGRTSR